MHSRRWSAGRGDDGRKLDRDGNGEVTFAAGPLKDFMKSTKSIAERRALLESTVTGD